MQTYTTLDTLSEAWALLEELKLGGILTGKPATAHTQGREQLPIPQKRPSRLAIEPTKHGASTVIWTQRQYTIWR
jgi:hypothetical protein